MTALDNGSGGRVVLVAAPVLLALARIPAYRPFRLRAAAASGAAALAWMAARLI
jgi:hypothetical protein